MTAEAGSAALFLSSFSSSSVRSSILLLASKLLLELLVGGDDRYLVLHGGGLRYRVLLEGGEKRYQQYNEGDGHAVLDKDGSSDTHQLLLLDVEDTDSALAARLGQVEVTTSEEHHREEV